MRERVTKTHDEDSSVSGTLQRAADDEDRAGLRHSTDDAAQLKHNEREKKGPLLAEVGVASAGEGLSRGGIRL